MTLYSIRFHVRTPLDDRREFLRWLRRSGAELVEIKRLATYRVKWGRA